MTPAAKGRITMGGWVIAIAVVMGLLPVSPDAREGPRGPGSQQRGGAHEQVERVTRTLALGRDGQVEVSNVSGAIVVRVGRREEVVIDAVKRGRGATEADAREALKGVEVEMSERPGRVEVRARYPDGRRRRDVRVEFTLTVPESTRLTLRSVAGDVEVTGVKGEIDVETISGDVRLHGVGPVTRAKTVAGDVVVDGADGDVAFEASTTSGRLSVRRVRARRLELSTVSGDIDVAECAARSLLARSLSGDLRFTGSLDPGGRYEFRAHSGDVSLVVPETAGFELDASTFSGEIISDLPLTLGGRRGSRTPGRSVRGVHRDGGALVEVTTFSGDVTVRTR